ncbi:AsmA family protein [Nitratireductor alexandrii]|uniref:AsmA family protein n=1 Tax=Nitratireductor alexandrii TaxID=2448161 RepID=UPI000FD6C4FF|nr:AsmA-like C-terminal region-containing protein [Nitratireductor alexandrii]
MRSRRARRSIWIVVTGIVAVLVVLAALPYVASTQIVRNRIAQEIGSWTGYRVVLRGTPRIDVWPVLRADLADVTFQEWGRPDAPPILQAERVELDLSAIAALGGDVSFSKMVLVRPRLRLERTQGPVPLPAGTRGGRISRAINAARALVEANPAAPDTGLMPKDALGTVEFVDGQIVVADEDGKQEKLLVSDLSGRLGWPSLDRAMTLAAKGVWRGENVAVEFTAGQPLALFAGGNTSVDFSLASAPLALDYDGLVTFSNSGFIDGAATLSSPSLRRVLEWSQTEISPGSAVGAASVSGRVIGDMSRLKVEDAKIVFGGNPGMGAIDLSFTGPVPAITGTLAFETLDIYTFLSAFSPSPAGVIVWDEQIDLSFAHELGLDLRLSANRATAGALSMTKVAAAVQVKDGLAAFDISDATAFGGTVQAGLRIEPSAGGKAAQLRILATDIDTTQVETAMRLTPPVPRARGTVSIILDSTVTAWKDFLSKAGGSVSVKLGSGTIAGLDLPGFLARAKQSGFFPLDEVSNGNLPIESAELKATVADGVARLDVAKAISGEQAISLTGIVPYVGRGLALSGMVAPRQLTGNAGPPGEVSAFFVGGSWNAPFVSPMLPPVETIE